jgi:hypothetical protein
MLGRIAIVVAGLTVALALPGRSLALGDVSLYLPPTALGTPPSKLAAWTLQAWADDGSAPYVTLERLSANRRVRETHILNGGVASLTFDGKRGSFQAQVGTALQVSMAIAATRSSGPVIDCSGRMRVPIVLRGTFVLGTGTRFFGTIHRSRATGVVWFKAEAPPDCSAPTSPALCAPGSAFGVGGIEAVARGRLMTWASPAIRPWTSATILAFGPVSPEAVVGPSPEWSHVMTVFGLNPLTGALPTLTVHMPPWSPIQGDGTFTARQTSEQIDNGCRTATTTGAFEGSFRAQFAGWGVRTLQIGPSDTASYDVRTSPFNLSTR